MSILHILIQLYVLSYFGLPPSKLWNLFPLPRKKHVDGPQKSKKFTSTKNYPINSLHVRALLLGEFNDLIEIIAINH